MTATTSAPTRTRRTRGTKLVAPVLPATGSTMDIIKPRAASVILRLACRTATPPKSNSPVASETEPSVLTSQLGFAEVPDPKVQNPQQAILEGLRTASDLLHDDQPAASQSACFWCTEHFTGRPVMIPRGAREGKCALYGCFCSPECAAGFLFAERLDESTAFERFQLLNQRCGRTETAIKPAPSPHYILDKFAGNLSVQQFRDIHSIPGTVMMVDKPFTRITPELYRDPMNTPNVREQAFTKKKKEPRLRRRVNRPSKQEALCASFGGAD